MATTSSPDTWQTVANMATALGVGIALVAVIVTLVMTLRSEKLTRVGQELEREQADAAAARTEAAAALTEEYTRRVVVALEAMADRGLQGAAAVERRRVSWSLRHDGGDTYRLENLGDAVAGNVIVNAHESLRLVDEPPPMDLRPGEALTFMAAITMGTRDTTITVTWQDEDAELRTWRYPLPARRRS